MDASVLVNNIVNTVKGQHKTDLAQIDNVDDIKKQSVEIPRGRPKSGRIWKTQKKRFISIKKTKGAHKTFLEKEDLRKKLKEIKGVSRSIQDQIKADKEEKKERRRINIKKTAENKLKAEIVQVISNPSKIRRMKKKQLRFIQKRDTAQVSK